MEYQKRWPKKNQIFFMGSELRKLNNYGEMK